MTDLQFTNTTTLNFMHFHKTGGVTIKSYLHNLYHKKVKGNGNNVTARDACYSRHKQLPGTNEEVSKLGKPPTFLVWRCDWLPIHELSASERNRHDVVFGHQFAKRGITALLTRRDVRSFTILRHPLHRKVSFFYHFFVRELGRKESDVQIDELKEFILYDRLTHVTANLGRDLGPNYMAGRILSDGSEGYVGNSSHQHFQVEEGQRKAVVEQVMRVLNGYVFVGMQTEPTAVTCMLKKMVHVFNTVMGVSNAGVHDFEQRSLNSGRYALGPVELWDALSQSERNIFERKEWVDLQIFRRGEELFKMHLRRFQCAHRVVDSKYIE